MATNMNRRDALHGAAYVGALALPAGVALADEVPALLGGTDPHVAWWREREELRAQADAFDARLSEAENFEQVRALDRERTPISKRQWGLEQTIVETAPTSPEGLAIVATVCLIWAEEVEAGDQEVEGAAGVTLSRHILAHTPPDVLRRAGLAGRAVA